VRLKIRHNAEIAHRLTRTQGKCQQIHGHGLQIALTFLWLKYDGETAMAVNNSGETFEFGEMKRTFRAYIDDQYDHRLLLNKADPFAGPIYRVTAGNSLTTDSEQVFLPGLNLMEDDPTVENLARWIAKWACARFKADVVCSIEETKTNGAEVCTRWDGFRAVEQP